MKYRLDFDVIKEEHLDSAMALVLDAYNEERKTLDYLPEGQGLNKLLYNSLSRLFRKGIGMAAFNDGELVGFIAGYETMELWGHCKGIYSPLYGHGAIKEDRVKIYQELYREAAEMWVKNHITSHALTVFAHDNDTIDAWFWLGFGNRCVDSIRPATSIGVVKSDIDIKKLTVDDLADIVESERGLHNYFNNSPMFMPRGEVDPITSLTDWLKEDDRHIWAAYKDGIAVGHMQIQTVGETFISEDPSVMNITGAYVLDSERSTGVAAILLEEILNWQKENGYSLCGVDFESFNIDGSRFWNRYFIPYTYTLTRRIDERILCKEGDK